MFRLSVVDHVRLNFGHVVQNYTVHAKAAERLAGLALKARFTVLALMGLATAVMVIGLLQPARQYQISAAIFAALATAIFALYVGVGVEGRVWAHRACAHRLWIMCERYRSLLAEIRDGLLNQAEVLRRRDELIQQTHEVYEQPFSIEQSAHETMRQMPIGAEGAPLSDELIDRFLPGSLRVLAHATAVDPPTPH
jgi:hypothetical protein